MAAVVAGRMAAARVEVAAVVVATMMEVLVTLLTIYRPSATVLIHFIFKLIFPKIKNRLKNSFLAYTPVYEAVSVHWSVSPPITLELKLRTNGGFYKKSHLIF